MSLHPSRTRRPGVIGRPVARTTATPMTVVVVSRGLRRRRVQRAKSR